MTACSPPHNLSDENIIASQPQIVTDFDGKITTIWKATTKEEGSIETSFIQSAVRSSAGKWLPAVNVSAIKKNVSDPQIAADGFGNIAAAWRNILSDDSIVVQFAKLSSEGIWSDPIDLSKEDEKAGIPQIDIDNTGNVMVVWPSETLNTIQSITLPSLDPRAEEMKNNLQTSLPSSTDSSTPALLLAPIINDMSPNHGPYAGGTLITITGSGFTGVTIVDFINSSLPPCPTGAPYCYTIVSDTEITFTITSCYKRM